MRGRYNEILVDKQRLEQANNSLRLIMEDERKELTDLRRQQQELINSTTDGVGIGDEMVLYRDSSLMRSYEAVKEDCALLRKRYDDLVSSHSAAVDKLECSQGSKILPMTPAPSGHALISCDHFSDAKESKDPVVFILDHLKIDEAEAAGHGDATQATSSSSSQ